MDRRIIAVMAAVGTLAVPSAAMAHQHHPCPPHGNWHKPTQAPSPAPTPAPTADASASATATASATAAPAPAPNVTINVTVVNPAPAVPAAPATQAVAVKKKVKTYPVKRCHYWKSGGKRHYRCFTVRVTRNKLSARERRRLHLA